MTILWACPHGSYLLSSFYQLHSSFSRMGASTTKGCSSTSSDHFLPLHSTTGRSSDLLNLNSLPINKTPYPIQHSSPSHFELLSNLNILYNNVNGLRHNPIKLTQLAKFAFNSNTYIIGIMKTNIDSKAVKFIPFNDHYKGFFSDCDDKIKGSGVALLVHEIWLKHLGKIESSNPYYLKATFYFKGILADLVTHSNSEIF
ncbi:hypothetical protein C1645_836237 [Glomus cerebriforme]|uniref:Uncharacterized protein n=1 Tax=Glomus cerebriforme TaxID=658196 RepID=A0A397SD00_9GLOM|nr:hypothetical protein C1645_836237 [Glomus cerebriforme]